MSWSPEQRLQFVDKLNSIEQVVVSLYRRLLVLIIVAVLVGGAVVLVRKPLGPGHQGEYFYFSMAALLALGWAVNQFIQAGRRQRRNSLPQVTFDSSAADGGHAWEFRIGPAAGEPVAADAVQTGFSRSFSIPLASIARDLLPSEEALTCLEAELARGVNLEDACQTIQPAYAEWGKLKRRAYQMYLTSLLEEHRRR